MATIKTAQTGNWADTTTWAGGVVPVAGDAAVIDDTHAVTVTADVTGGNAPDSVAADAGENGTLHFGAYTFQCGGIITLDRLTATLGAGLIAADVDIGTDGSLTQTADAQITGNVTIDGGTLTDAGYTLTVNEGDFLRTSGSVASTGKLLCTNTSRYDLNNGVDPSNAIAELEIPTSSHMRLNGGTGHAVGKATVGGELSLVSTDDQLFFTNVAAGWWGLQTGTVRCSIFVANTTNSPGNDITLSDGTLNISPDAAGVDLEITINSDITLGNGALQVYGGGFPVGGGSMTLHMNGNLDMNWDLGMGLPFPVDISGIVNLGGGIHRLRSIKPGQAVQSNAINFGSSTVIASATIDCDNIAVTSDGVNIHGGIIQKVTSTGIVHCWGVTDGGANNADVAHESSLGGATANVGTGMIGMAA